MDTEKTIWAKIITNSQNRDWGTIFDNKNLKKENIPSKCVGATFSEMNHDNVRKFLSMSDFEKFEYAFYAEKINSRRAGKMGFVLGVIVTIFLAILIIQL